MDVVDLVIRDVDPGAAALDDVHRRGDTLQRWLQEDPLAASRVLFTPAGVVPDPVAADAIRRAIFQAG